MDDAQALRLKQEEHETHLQFLFERITELHRDKQKRWSGRKARIQADAEWAKVKRGEPLERIELRDGFERLKPSTYELA